MTRPGPLAPGLMLAVSLAMASSTWAAAGNGAPPVAAPPPVPPAPTLSDLGRSLRNYFTADELDILFQYMRDSVIAAFKGEEVTLPPDLAFKLEVLLARMKKEGGHYMDNLIRQLEKDLERNLKEKLAPPDTSVSPYVPANPVFILPPVMPPPQFSLPMNPPYPLPDLRFPYPPRPETTDP